MAEVKISNALKANYDNYYEEEDSEWRRLGARAKAQNIISLCEGLPNHSVLEIGAGEGSILKRLSELDFANEYYAVEISTSGIAAINSKRIPHLVECKVFDGYQIPYADRSFDIAILSHVIEHVEHPRQLLYEASRVANYVFVEVPLEDMSRLSRDFVFDKVGHINFYSPRTIRWLVQSCNLRVLRQITTNPSKATYTYHKGQVGLINYYIKQILLNLFPGFATKNFPYHGSRVCEGKTS